MLKLMTRAACLLALAVPGPHAPSLAVQPPEGGWAAPHLIVPRPVFVFLRVRCAEARAAACVLVGTEGRWVPDPTDGERMLGGPFFLELTVEGPFVDRGFAFALPLNEDRSAVQFALGDGGLPFGAPQSRNDVQLFTCFQLLTQRVGTLLAECAPVPSRAPLPERVRPDLCVNSSPSPPSSACLSRPPGRSW